MITLNKIIPDGIFTTQSTADVYFLRTFYDQYVLNKEYYPYQFDGWSDKKYYGVLDNQKNVIYPKQSYLKEYSNSTSTQHKNVLFVTDAFKDLKDFTSELAKRNKVSNSSIYTKLNVSTSTESVPDKYLKYINDLYGIFKNNYLDQTTIQEIKNIQDFCNHFTKFIKIITRISPVNRSTFIKSRLINQNINGLRISLDNPPANINLRSIANNYVGNSEFELFIENAGRFGFYVDRNMPWVIVSDLESPVTKKYAARYNLGTTDQIFDVCYHKAYKADLESLKNVLLSFWNTFADNNSFMINTTDVPDCKNLFTEVAEIHQLDMPTFEKYFGIEWQLRLYLFTKVLEEKINITQNKFETIYIESVNINNFYNTDESLKYINIKIQELLDIKLAKPQELTTLDTVVRMLTTQVKQLPLEGINF